MSGRPFALLVLFALVLSISSCTAPTSEPPSQSAPTLTVSAAKDPTSLVRNPTPQAASPETTPTLAITSTSLATPVSITTSVSAGIITPVPTIATALDATPLPGADPDLEMGFPIETRFVNSSNFAPAMLVGNIDGDPALEMLVVNTDSTTGHNQITAFHIDGSVVRGWPVKVAKEASQNVGMSMGNLTDAIPGLEIVAPITATYVITVPSQNGTERSVSHEGIRLNAYAGDGSVLPGWPAGEAIDTSLPFLVDIDGDNLDEVFIRDQALRADGSPIAAWPKMVHALAAGDLDGDGVPDILTPEEGLRARHVDGTPLHDFTPPTFQDLADITKNYVIGDVDGDGAPEVLRGLLDFSPTESVIHIQVLSTKGEIKRTISFPGRVTSGVIPLALGDLDCDGAPEILTQTEGKLHAWQDDGTAVPGWPKEVYAQHGPVIGDVDGDGWADIVTVALMLADGSVQLQAYDRFGVMLPRFPKSLGFGRAAEAVIADIDNDGRNEILVASAYGRTGNSINEEADAIWAFDLHGSAYGPVQWGQFAGGPQRQNYYSPSTPSCQR